MLLPCVGWVVPGPSAGQMSRNNKRRHASTPVWRAAVVCVDRVLVCARDGFIRVELGRPQRLTRFVDFKLTWPPVDGSSFTTQRTARRAARSYSTPLTRCLKTPVLRS